MIILGNVRIRHNSRIFSVLGSSYRLLRQWLLTDTIRVGPTEKVQFTWVALSSRTFVASLWFSISMPTIQISSILKYHCIYEEVVQMWAGSISQ